MKIEPLVHGLRQITTTGRKGDSCKFNHIDTGNCNYRISYDSGVFSVHAPIAVC